MSPRVRLIVAVTLFGCLSSPIWSRQRFRLSAFLGPTRSRKTGLPIPQLTFSQRHSLLSQITPQTSRTLKLQWIYQARSLEKFEPRLW